jgi:predicted nucleotidyltransferase
LPNSRWGPGYEGDAGGLSRSPSGRTRNVRVFGSVARGDDGPDSDIDFLVDLDAGVGLIKLAGLERELSTLLGRPWYSTRSGSG